ncbi:MAG: DUF2019 domain-containing protein [Methylovirgula sp.]
MKSSELEQLTVDELVERFAEICIAEDDALFRHQHAKFNRLFKTMCAVGNELRRRGRGARLELQRLYRHPNMQVRLKAAKWTLAVAPDAARNVIQSIRDSKWPPQYLEAGMCLSNLDDGTFRPD